MAITDIGVIEHDHCCGHVLPHVPAVVVLIGLLAGNAGECWFAVLRGSVQRNI
jgi:hypothetical protein